MKVKRNELLLISIVLAFCSIVYELLLSNTLSIVTGDHVFWQSVTIGIYVGGLGLGAYYFEKITCGIYQLFAVVELSLSFLGGFSVILIYLLHGIFKYFENIFYYSGNLYTSSYVQSVFLLKILFFIFSQFLTLIIGFLSGLEIPMLIKLSKFKETDATEDNFILGFSYFGTLLGTLAFGFLLVPKLDVLLTSFLVSILNLLICFYFVLKYINTKKIKFYLMTSVVFFLMIVCSLNEKIMMQSYLKFYYFLPRILSENNADLEDFKNKFYKLPDVKREKSLYQYVDIFNYPTTSDGKTQNSTILTLDTNFQFNSSTEYFYHQAFAHVSIALNKKIPEKILILGGGDGLLLRELLKYKEIKYIKHIELDQKITDLGLTEFSNFNKNSLKDKRVHLEINDGFYYVRNTLEKFDAVFIDFPYPNSYDLARLYSIEFYKNVINVLSKDAFLVMDTPFYLKDNELIHFKNKGLNYSQAFNDRHFLSNSVIASTLHYSGFKSIFPYRVMDESFLFLKINAGEINYDFEKNLFQNFINEDVRNEISNIKNQNFPFEISERFINSIFLPRVIKKGDL